MTIRIPRGKPYKDTLDFIQKRLNGLDTRVLSFEDGEVTFLGSGSSTNADAATQPAKFDGGATPVAGNMIGININKSGYEALLTGINKNSATGEIPPNATYFSTYVNSGSLTFGRGNSAGAPNYADIEITSTGRVKIPRSMTLLNLPTSNTSLSTGDLFTQTATELGGSGTTKILCVV